jgi:hypothetical protein
MVKSFIFDDPIINEEKILRFSQNLVLYSNYQSIIHTRFHNLIHDFDLNSSKLNKDETISYTDNLNINNESHSFEYARKSYQIPTDLQQDLIDSKCDNHICVKSGYAEVIPNKFIIDT